VPPPWRSINWPNGHFMVAVTIVEAGYAMFAEWKELIGRHAGFFNYDPESRAYCMITAPAPVARHAGTDVATRRRHAAQSEAHVL